MSCLLHDLVHLAVQSEAKLSHTFYGNLARAAKYSVISALMDENSCLMQDEPEQGHGFSRKMSLKGVGIGMLGIDYQHGRFGSDEPGTDPGIFGSEQRGSIFGTAASRGIRVGGANAGTPRVREHGA